MNSKSTSQAMETEKIPRLLAQLAIPAVVAQIINLLYNIVDRIYIGHISGVGAAALTGVGLFTPILMLINAFAMLAGSGGAPRAAISMGKKDNKTAEKILGNCFALLILMAVVLTVVFFTFAPQLLTLFGASEKTLPYGVAYARIYILGGIFVLIVMGMNPFITTQGFAKISMMTTVIGAVINIILDPIFIFVFHLGVRGAALATVLSQAVGAIWILRFLSGKKTILHLRKENFRLQKDVILPCLGLGISTFVMLSTESLLSISFTNSLSRYGGDVAVGAMTILSSVMQFALLPLQGISQGAQPILSFNYGAKNVERVRKTFRVLLTVCLTYSALIWAFVMLCPRVFAGIFTPDAELIEFTGRALRIYCAVLAIFGIQRACQITFVSIGKAVCSIIVAVMRKFVLLIPLIYLMPHLVPDPTLGVYLAEPVADTLAVTFTSILFSHQFRKALRTLESERSA